MKPCCPSLCLLLETYFPIGGSYLIYMDTTHDAQGADVDVARRPITVGDPFKPEFRFAVSMVDVFGTVSASYTLNAWVENDWQEITFTGGAAIDRGAPSIIELQIPLTLIGSPQFLNLAAVSTGRAHSASDILGTTFTPAETDTPLTLDQFFPVDLSN